MLTCEQALELISAQLDGALTAEEAGALDDACRHSRSFFFNISYNRLGCQEGGCNAGCILKRASGYLGRIQNTCLNHIHILFFICIEACSYRRLFYFIDNNRAFQTSIRCNME